MERVVIVDIDHTVADAAWRDALLGQWDEYYAASIWDRPVVFVKNLIEMAYAHGREVVAVTARPEDNRQMTMRWMIQHDIPIDVIHMRASDDRRPSTEVKRDLITLNFPDLSVIEFVLEDRDDAVAMYRQLGLNVLQVNIGARDGNQGLGITRRGDVYSVVGDQHGDGGGPQGALPHAAGRIPLRRPAKRGHHPPLM
jgi:hypothetical protein